jgi:hypothetical protein
MTRFEQEISGLLDKQVAERKGTENNHYWEKSAKAEVEKAVKEADEKAIVEEDGAIRWIASGNYLPDDFCEKLEYAGYAFSREATRQAKEVQSSEAIEAYRRQARQITTEEIEEMRSAFGRGTVVVDIITGQRIAI